VLVALTASAAALARYAQLCGRRTTTRALLENFMRAERAPQLSSEAESLRRELQGG